MASVVEPKTAGYLLITQDGREASPVVTPCSAATPAEWGWAAGLFEGEGSIIVQRHSPAVRLSLKSTDEDVVRRLWAIAGGKMYGPYAYIFKDGHARKPFWVWHAELSQVNAIMLQFWPWLGERRRARALEAGIGAE